MSDDLKELLDSVRTLTAVERGDLDLSLFNKHRRVFGQDATAVLVVPWQYSNYGLSTEQSAEVWEAMWNDPVSLSAWAEYMEAVRVYFNIPPPPEPTPPVEPDPDPPPPKSRSTRKPENPITAALKSLAGRRRLSR